MLYTTSCSDKFGSQYDINIITNGSTSSEVKLTCAGDPVNISMVSDSLFAPIKSRSMTLEIVTTEFYPDLYTPQSRGASIRLYNRTSGKCMFNGYVTPCQYDQNYSNLDTITLECVDALSTCKDYKWEGPNENMSFYSIINTILYSAGYRNHSNKLWVPESYTMVRPLEKLWCSGSNFYDDDDAHTGWTQYEIIEEIMQFMGWSMIPDGYNVYIVDAAMTANLENQFYMIYDIGSTTSTTSYAAVERVTINEIETPGTPNISIDNIYNRIEISDNLYEIDTVAPDIFDDDTHISVTEESLYEGNDTLNVTRWTSTQTKKFLWWTTSKKTDITGYDYQTLCRLNPNSGWKHYYYRIADLMNDPDPLPNDDGLGYTDPNPGSAWEEWTAGVINRKINTHGCLVQHHAYRPEEGKNNLPSSLDWEDILTFFVTGPTTSNFRLADITHFEQPVLEYDIDEEVNWRPATGTSWITIKGDLLYQYSGAKYGDKKKNTVTVVNDKAKYYTTCPVIQAVDISGQKYVSVYRDYDTYKDISYGKGYKCWKMQLRIGTKYWNGTNWVNYTGDWRNANAPYFYINYNNGPADRDDEYVSAFEWMSIVPNTDFTDKVGEQAYCIPLDSEHDAPLSGDLQLIVYTPSLIPEEARTIFTSLYPNEFNDISWKDLPPVVYCKGFELGYVYTDTNVWYKQHTTQSDSDLTYVAYIDDNYVQDFDTLEFKLNTAQNDRPISRSYVLYETTQGDKNYLTNMQHKTKITAREQEHNICDRYIDHYSERKIIYKCNVRGYMDPRVRYNYTQLSDKFILDSQEWNLRSNNSTLKLIQY